jgi:pyruvate ferredoxin oxidoreductase alpha subunit
VVVALGSVLGTIKDTVDELRDDGMRIGALAIKTFRPFPIAEVNQALLHAKRIVVLEKALAIGIGGIVSLNVRIALSGQPQPVHTVIAGLGGRPITKDSLRRLFRDAATGGLHQLTFLDLDMGLVERELQRTRDNRRSGPHAENMIRDVGAVAAKSGVGAG